MRRTTHLAVVTLTALLLVGAPAVGATGVAPTAGAADGAVASGVPTPATDAELPERWRATVGGDGDEKLSTGLRTDGGYLVAGWSDGSTGDGHDDGYVALVDRSGRTTWERTLGGPGTDRVFDVVAVEDGYLLAGISGDGDGNWDGWLLKLGQDGDTLWQETYGTSTKDAFWSLARTDDAVYVAGWQGDEPTEAWAMALGSGGTVRWSETYDTQRSATDEYVESVHVTDNGDLLLAGGSGSNSLDTDAWLLRVDDHGNEIWAETYGGGDYDRFYDVAPADGGYVLAGQKTGVDGDRDAWVLKVEPDGEKHWERTYGSDEEDAFYAVLARNDGFVLSGARHEQTSRGANGWLVRTDDGGHREWAKTFGQRNWDRLWPTLPGHDGGVLALGETTNDGDDRDGWLMRLGGPVVSPLHDADENASGITVAFEDSSVRSVTLDAENASGVLGVDEVRNDSALSNRSAPGEVVAGASVFASVDDGAVENASVESVPTANESVVSASGAVTYRIAGEDATNLTNATLADLRIAQRTADGWSVMETKVVSESNESVVLAADTGGAPLLSAAGNETARTASTTLAVTVVEAPSAAVTLPESVAPGETATLDASESRADDGSLASYRWSVGDETFTGETASATFDEPGAYPVELAVTDAAGLRDTATATLVVNDEPGLTVDVPDSVTVGDAATLSATVENQVGDATVTWQFDRNRVEGRTIEHSFGSAGTKTVTVVVEDEYGATVRTDVSVQVESREQSDSTTTSTETGSVPGFGVGSVLLAVAALVGVALLAGRQ